MELGIPAPVNKLLVEVVKAVETEEIKPAREILGEVIKLTD